MAVIFFHIPRTGGSSVWHSLARLAANTTVGVHDLYEHSNRLTGSPYRSLDAASDLQHLVEAGGTRALVHHHTRQNITAILPPDRHDYVTILRDPVARLVSEAFYIRSLIPELGVDSPVLSYYRQLVSPEFVAKLCNPAVGPDELVLHAAAEPFYRNYYLNSFWQLLFGSTQQSGPAFEQISEIVVPALAFAIRQRFRFIGQFAQNLASVNAIAQLVELHPANDTQLIRVANAAPASPLRLQTIAQIQHLHAADYNLLKAIAAPYPVPEQTPRRGALRQLLAGQAAIMRQQGKLLLTAASTARHEVTKLTRRANAMRHNVVPRLAATGTGAKSLSLARGVRALWTEKRT